VTSLVTSAFDSQVAISYRHSIVNKLITPTVFEINVSPIGVTTYFISNFVAMASGVGRGGICLRAFNSPNPKYPCCVQESRRYLLQKASYCLFCFTFLLTKRSRRYLLHKPSYSRFLSQISLPWQQGSVVVEFA